LIGKLMVNDFQKILMETKQLLRDEDLYRSKPDSSGMAMWWNGSCRLSCVKDEARGRLQEAPAGVTLDRMLRETEKMYEEVTGRRTS